jgi:ABC-2 type transport system permease protein
MYFDRFNLGNLSNQALRQVIVASLGRKLTSPVPNLTGLITRLQAKEPLIVPHNVAETGIDQARGEGASFILVYVFALLLLFSAFTTSGYLMQSVVEEKENRMVEILLSSMRPRDLLAGKILALGLLGLFQMLVWGGVIVFLITQFSAGIPGVPVTPALVGLNITASQLIILAIYFVLGYMLFATLYASVGSIATNMREGPQIAAFVTIPAVIPLYALAVFTAAPNGPLPVALSLIPLTSPLSMVMRAAITDVPAGEVLISVILLTLFIGFTMWLAGRLFRVNTLLSGQMPRLRDLVRLVRESV